MADNVSRKQYIERINRVTRYINEHIDETIQLKQLAEVASFSAFHFHRLFTAITGETPRAYVNRIRLERAANLLMHNNDQSITDVALACGFTSSAVFSRAFRDNFDCSPTDWQQGKHSKNCKIDSKNGEALLTEPHYATGFNNDEHLEELAMQIEIRELPAWHVAYTVNNEGYDDEKVNAAWDKLLNWAQPRKLVNGDTTFIGMPLDNPHVTDEDKCRYYACITVPENTETRGEISQLNTRAGAFAVYSFEGTADEIVPAYEKIFGEWFPNSGYQPDDILGYEIYKINGNVIEEAKKDPVVRMDICIPVKPL